MGNLILDSLEISNFRAFQHLTIERLGRINLLVGQNNIGKTSLLEAIALYAARGSLAWVWGTLEKRQEFKPASSGQPTDFRTLIKAFSTLFYGRAFITDYIDNPVRISTPTHIQQEVIISAGWFVGSQDGEGNKQWKFARSAAERAEAEFRVTIQFRDQAPVYYLLDPYRPFFQHSPPLTCVFVEAYGLEKEQATGLWDAIALTERETEVLTALRLLEPEVEGLNFIGTPEGTERIPMVKLAGRNGPIPLRAMGDGMNRLNGIALALANAKNGLLLIDEFENGLHYSVQPAIWKFIFQLARRLNVQVFATTHSWDCIQAFQQALQDDEKDDGLIIRLQRSKDTHTIVSVLLDKKDREVLTRMQLEVR